MTDPEPRTLGHLLDRIHKATQDSERVSLGEIMDEVGHRSFGALLLVAGLVTVMPLVGDIPGVPTIMGLLVVLIGGQLLAHRDHFWLPDWLLERSVEQDTLRTSLDWLERPAQFVDRWLQPRLTRFTQRTAMHLVAVACILIAAVMPLLEFIPFSANLAGAALTAFGLSLIAHDGLLAVFAFGFTLLTFGVVAHSFL